MNIQKYSTQIRKIASLKTLPRSPFGSVHLDSTQLDSTQLDSTQRPGSLNNQTVLGQATRMLATGACCLVLMVGCNKNASSLAPISGVVTLDGKPLANATIGFEPYSSSRGAVAGPGTYAITDESGRYRLETLDHQVGASLGMCRVAISTFRAKRGDDGAPVVLVKERVPAKYNGKTTLTFEVLKEGTDSADFSLLSK